MTTLLQREIAQQPAVLRRLLAEGWQDTRAVAAAIREFDPAFVCIAARGTSLHAGIYAKYLFGAALKLPVMLASPSLHTLYAAPPALSRALVIGISQSGQAEDARLVLQEARAQGALTLAITNFDDSPLAATARLHLPLRAGMERSVAATKTYTAQLTAIAMLADALSDAAGLAEDLARLPQLASETLDMCAGIDGWAARYQDMDRLTILGRGCNYATACEIALKVRELTYISGEGFSEAEFQHGPIAVVQPGYPVMLVAPSGKTLPGMRDMLGVLKDKGADALVISDDAAALQTGARAMPIPQIGEWLSPFLAVMPGQVFAMRQAIVRGYDVDKPRGLSKVTITE